MLQGLRNVDWDDYAVSIPVFLTMVAMPLTFSIANGVSFGVIFITHRMDELSAIGDRITVVGYKARDGSNVASAREIVLANGRKVFVGSPYDGGPQP